MSNNIGKNDHNNINEEHANNETLFMDFEEYKLKFLENKKIALDNYINDSKISDKEKIIKFLESEFYFLEEQQKAIHYSNEEMKKYCTEEDEEINECRAENMKILFKNFERMKKIKSEILALDRSHYLKDKDLFSFCKNLEQEYKNQIDLKNNPLIVEFIDRSGENYHHADENQNIYKDKAIIREIDL